MDDSAGDITDGIYDSLGFSICNDDLQDVKAKTKPIKREKELFFVITFEN